MRVTPNYQEFARVRRQARSEEAAQEQYDELFAAEEARQRAEWEEQFDSPFRPNGAEIHQVVLRQIAAMSK